MTPMEFIRLRASLVAGMDNGVTEESSSLVTVNEEKLFRKALF
jgi:hypothetical protein